MIDKFIEYTNKGGDKGIKAQIKDKILENVHGLPKTMYLISIYPSREIVIIEPSQITSITNYNPFLDAKSYDEDSS